MRISHCTVALVLVLIVGGAGVGFGQTPGAPQPSSFTIFYRGIPIGAEEVSVSSTPEGVLITGTERTGAPLNVIIRRAEIRYTRDWRPVECILEGSVRDSQIVLSTKVSGTTASTLQTQGTNQSEHTAQIGADDIFLPSLFFAASEALAARLLRAQAGEKLQAFTPPLATMTVSVLGVTEDRVRTQSALVEMRRYAVEFAAGKDSASVELWADLKGRLLRFAVPAQGLDVVRTDIAAVTSRRESVARPNDEQIQIPSNGFNLLGTLSKPSAAPDAASRKGPKLPAVILLSGSDPTDRDEIVAGIPILGQLSTRLADAGYIVVRYDKRGFGQSGGRAESVTVEDYAEDAIAAMRFLERRRDVDSKRIALVGYGEGGAVAAVASSRTGKVAAIVLVAAPGVGGAELVLDQQRQLLTQMKVSDAERQAKLQMQQAIQQAVISGTWPDSIPTEMRRQADTSWYRSYLLFDPEKTLKKTKMPILVVHGELDRQILPSNADRLAEIGAARKGKAGQAVKVVKVPGVNHLLVAAKTGEADEYERLPDRTINADVVSAITTWLASTLGAR
jgi:pimeloyl-ACP methyl ester carboxylesterase